MEMKKKGKRAESSSLTSCLASQDKSVDEENFHNNLSEAAKSVSLVFKSMFMSCFLQRNGQWDRNELGLFSSLL